MKLNNAGQSAQHPDEKNSADAIDPPCSRTTNSTSHPSTLIGPSLTGERSHGFWMMSISEVIALNSVSILSTAQNSLHKKSLSCSVRRIGGSLPDLAIEQHRIWGFLL